MNLKNSFRRKIKTIYVLIFETIYILIFEFYILNLFEMFIKPKEIIDFLATGLFLRAGFNVADFGCGGGYFTTLIADKVGPEGKVFAIDIQEDALIGTKELAETLGYKNIEFHRADLKKTVFESDFFDVVFMSQVLFQNQKINEIFKEARRILKNGGYLIVLEPSANAENDKSFSAPKNEFSAFNFIYGDIVEKNKTFEILGEENFSLLLDKEYKKNYYLAVWEK